MPAGGLKASPTFLRLLALGALALTALAAACGDDGGGGGPALTGTPGTATPSTSTATAAPAATPRPGEATGWEGFQQLATKMEEALAAKDVDFFVERAFFSDYTCPAAEEPTPPCEQEGQVLQVMTSVPVLPSEPALLEAGPLRDTVQRFFDAAQLELGDSYGDGALELYSIARRGQEGGNQEYWALLTMMSTRDGSPQRELMILRFRFQNGRWEYVAVLQGALLEGFGIEKYFSQAPEDLNWERRQQ